MSRSDDITTLFPGAANPSITWHTGVVDAWDDLSGSNTVSINDQEFNDLRVLSTGAVQPFAPGDVVGVMMIGTTAFILGKIRAPGAGAGEQIRSARVATLVTVGPQGFAPIASSPGPVCTDVYIGSSRRCLVIHSCEVITSLAAAYQGVVVTGASSIPVETGVTDAFFRNDGSPVQASSTSTTTLVTAADGLKSGFNTFTAQYKVTVTGAGTGVQLNNRVLTVIPF